MSFFRYPGGKRKLLKAILPRIPRGHTFVEPFFGGGSVGTEVLKADLFSHHVFNDMDDPLVALWTAVRDTPQELLALVDAFEPSVEAFHKMRGVLRCGLAGDTLYGGFCKLAVHQMSYSGLGMKAGGPIGGASQSSAYGVGCRWSPATIRRKVEALHPLLQTATFTSMDFGALLAESHDAFLYLDPPYYEKGGELYEHAFTEHDHARMAAALRERGSWLLSYDDHPSIREMYSWARIDEVEMTCTINGARRKIELLISPPGDLK